MSETPRYEVYAIRYGHHDRRSSENFIGGDPHDTLQPLDFFLWAIIGPGGPFIVDTGLRRKDGAEAPAQDPQTRRRRTESDRHRSRQGREA